MNRRLSVGARWTLRFTLALLVTVSLFAAGLYSQVVARTESDARTMLALQVQELARDVELHGADSRSVRRSLDRSVAVAEAEFKLGLKVYGADGEPTFSGGSLTRYEIGLPDPMVEVVPDESLSEQDDLFREVEHGEAYPYLVMTLPAGQGVVQGAIYTRRFVRSARDLRNLYLYAAPVMLLVTAAMGYWLARGSLRTIQDITRTARRISATRLDERIPTTGTRDELEELAATLNEMMDRIERGVERHRRFAANAAHELRTPLNRLRAQLEVALEKERSPAEYRDVLAGLAREVSGLSEDVHALMRLARTEAGLAPDQRSPVEVVGLLSEVVDFFEPLAAEKRIRLSFEDGDPVHIAGDASWLHQLFANLVHNAIKYTPEGGSVAVAIARDEQTLRVSVDDDGPGIPETEAERVFEPFHRVGSAPDAPGVGLGLALARELARAHGGDVAIERKPAPGTRFVVRLPLSN